MDRISKNRYRAKGKVINPPRKAYYKKFAHDKTGRVTLVEGEVVYMFDSGLVSFRFKNKGEYVTRSFKEINVVIPE